MNRKAAAFFALMVVQACVAYYSWVNYSSLRTFLVESSSLRQKVALGLFKPPSPSSSPVDASYVNNSMDNESRPLELGSSKSSSDTTWRKGSFCEKFVEKQFDVPVGVCGREVVPEHSIKCLRSSRNPHMVYCTLENAAMLGPRAARARPEYKLLEGEKKCPNPSAEGVHKTSEKGDPTRITLDKIIAQTPIPSSVCQVWINKTAFLYAGDQAVHIYFRMNAYFNLHKAIISEGVDPGEFVIIRLSHDSQKLTYLFPEWEKKLFPELVHIDELPNVTICFRKTVLVPHAFAGVLFRCKMESSVSSDCFNCKGRGLYGTSLYSFRHRVLSSCGLIDSDHQQKRITLISRTPYERWKGDKSTKFQRVLSNEKELVDTLRSKFPHTNTTVAHMEGLPICTQIGLAHQADVVMGVHGAGLVHLWWLQENGLALELNPSFELSNPTFKMLSTLAGRNYVSITLTSSARSNVRVNVDSVIKELRAHTHLS